MVGGSDAEELGPCPGVDLEAGGNNVGTELWENTHADILINRTRRAVGHTSVHSGVLGLYTSE